MGFFGRLFGGGPRKPPTWARAAFGEDGEKFEVFAALVAEVLDAKNIYYREDAIRSGSLILATKKGGTREIMLEETAAACAGVDQNEWRETITSHIISGKRPKLGAGPAPGQPRAWIIGTSPWGGVLFECGPQEMLLVLLPTTDKAPVPTFPPGLIRAIVVCNARDEGNLAATAVARNVGLS